jgi:hypothetical protein
MSSGGSVKKPSEARRNDRRKAPDLTKDPREWATMKHQTFDAIGRRASRHAPSLHELGRPITSRNEMIVRRNETCSTSAGSAADRSV